MCGVKSVLSGKLFYSLAVAIIIDSRLTLLSMPSSL